MSRVVQSVVNFQINNGLEQHKFVKQVISIRRDLSGLAGLFANHHAALVELQNGNYIILEILNEEGGIIISPASELLDTYDWRIRCFKHSFIGFVNPLRLMPSYCDEQRVTAKQDITLDHLIVAARSKGAYQVDKNNCWHHTDRVLKATNGESY